MSLDQNKFRIIRLLDTDGTYLFRVQQKRFGIYWNISFVFKTGTAEWSPYFFHYFLNPMNEKIRNFTREQAARNFITGAIFAESFKIKNKRQRKQLIQQRKADAYKVIKFH